MKPWYTSKTIWANVLTALTVALAAPEIRELMGPNAIAYISAGQALINIVLRFVTVAPIASGSPRGPGPGLRLE